MDSPAHAQLQEQSSLTCGRVLQALVCNDDGMLGKESYLAHVSRPDCILQKRAIQLCSGCSLLDIKQHHL